MCSCCCVKLCPCWYRDSDPITSIAKIEPNSSSPLVSPLSGRIVYNPPTRDPTQKKTLALNSPSVSSILVDQLPLTSPPKQKSASTNISPHSSHKNPIYGWASPTFSPSQNSPSQSRIGSALGLDFHPNEQIRPHILVAESVGALQSQMQKWIIEEIKIPKAHIAIASTGEEASQQLAVQKFDLIIFGLKMTRDAENFLRNLKRPSMNGDSSSIIDIYIPILHWGSTSERTAPILAGKFKMDGYIPKPAIQRVAGRVIRNHLPKFFPSEEKQNLALSAPRQEQMT